MANYIEQGKSFLEKKEYTKALEFFQAAIENMESPKDAHLGLAEALFAVKKSEQGKISLFKAMALDPNNPHGLSMIQEHCFPNATITPNTICSPSVDQDPVINIKPHHVLGKNYYVAEQQSGNKLYFRVGSKGCTIVCPGHEEEYWFWDGYEEPKGDVVIPDNFNINNRCVKVIAIDECVFCDNKSIISIALPDSLQEIGIGAFQDASISDIILPPFLKVIGGSAFEGTSISEIVLPPKLQILGNGTFGKTQLKEIEIPSQVKTIGKDCFSGCQRLSEVHLNDGLIQIGENAFNDCNIHEIDIPESVKSIGDDAFPPDTIVKLHGDPPKIDNYLSLKDRYVVLIPSNKAWLYEEDDDWQFIKVSTY